MLIHYSELRIIPTFSNTSPIIQTSDLIIEVTNKVPFISYFDLLFKMYVIIGNNCQIL